MNSSVNPSSESSNSRAFDKVQTGKQAATGTETSPLPAALTVANDQALLNRQQPIPPPSEPMQYRAIGLVSGRYKSSAEQFTQGTLVVTDGTELNVVLLGRIISLLKNHLDLEQEHLWVVYPRTGQEDGNLHLQLVGVWEPEKLNKESPATTRPTPDETPLKSQVEAQNQVPNKNEESAETTTPTSSSPEVADGYFSIRGEIIYQSAADGHFIVKIKQAPRKESEKPKYFKLKIQGDLATKAVGQFWDLQVKRQAESLVLEKGEAIATLPSKPKLKKNKPQQGKYPSGRRDFNTSRPVRQAGDSIGVKPPVPKSPTPKPIKRQKPLQ